MHGKINYTFSGLVWQHNGPGGWHFISLPKALSTEIRDALRSEEEGWGRLKATATIGGSEWETAIWFDTKQQAYLLPIKGAIRDREKIKTGGTVSVSLWL